MADAYFRFLRPYASSLGSESQRIRHFTAGDVIELPEDTGAWIERDSPGTVEQIQPDQIQAALAERRAYLDDLYRRT